MRLGLVGFVFVALTGSAIAADTSSAKAAASGFYDAYQTIHPSDGIPDAQALARLEPYLSVGLSALLTQGAQAEIRFATANKNSPPLVEGDLFTSLFEGATRVSVGNCALGPDDAKCVVNLEHADPKTPTNWNDTIVLVKTAAGWRVDDIAYGGTWAFGNKGTLSQTLKQIIAFQ